MVEATETRFAKVTDRPARVIRASETSALTSTATGTATSSTKATSTATERATEEVVSSPAPEVRANASRISKAAERPARVFRTSRTPVVTRILKATAKATDRPARDVRASITPVISSTATQSATSSATVTSTRDRTPQLKTSFLVRRPRFKRLQLVSQRQLSDPHEFSVPAVRQLSREPRKLPRRRQIDLRESSARAKRLL